MAAMTVSFFYILEINSTIRDDFLARFYVFYLFTGLPSSVKLAPLRKNFNSHKKE